MLRATILFCAVGCGSSASGSAPWFDAGAGADADPALPDADSDADAGAVPAQPDSAPPACTLALHYGHGAAVIANNWSAAELAVRVLCGGAPAAGRSVQWSLGSGDGVLGATATGTASGALTTDTGGDGIARAVYRYPSGFSQPSWSTVSGSVTATLDAESVELIVTAFNPGQSSPMLPQAIVLVPAGGGNGADLGSGKAGAVLPGALRVAVSSAIGVSAGQGVPNIGIRVFGADDDALHCTGAAYTALSDAQGIAVCDLKLPATPGEHVFDLDVGRVLEFQGLRVHVTP